jgi:formylglycine-generating enzyme required for sulfatase activity
MAYADWSGLRPMTELEFEKACRGPVFPVPAEYAWGNTIIRILKTTTGEGTATETDNDTPRANAHCCQGLASAEGTNPLAGPMRGGWTVGGSRENSGDSYFGISDLSGNVEEYTICVGSPTHRAFTGSHGDGNLSASGHATNSDWPGYNAAEGKVAGAVKFFPRGGSTFGDPDDFPRLRVSRRLQFYDETESRRYHYFGFRGVRSAR